MPSHTPEWHLLDSAFPDHDRGLVPPSRNLSAGGASLRILNLDRADPPGYRPGGVPRGAAFNANIFRVTADPCMPPIDVACEAAGFDPSQAPIEWRLVCRHVLGRFTNSGGFRYRGICRPFEREWRGQSRTARFTLFAEDCPCSYNEPGRVLGGHAILAVAVALPAGTLLDYVHLQIAGTNPVGDDVLRFLDARLAGYDSNVVKMLHAVFRHESSLSQFAPGAQTATSMKFSRVHHPDPAQSDCRVRFDWPDDPPAFPLGSYDFGVGISQWTDVGTQRVTADIAWDWRENLRLGINRLLGAVTRAAKPGLTWQQVARTAWAAYNGAGPAAAAYAARLAATPDGLSISASPIAGPTQVASSLRRPRFPNPPPGSPCDRSARPPAV